MSLRQPLGDLNGNVDGLFQLQWSPFDFLFQRFAFVAGHADKHLPLFSLVDLVDSANVRMIQSGGCLGFLNETSLDLWILSESGWQELEGDSAFQLDVLSSIQYSHSASAERFKDFVVRYGFPDHSSIDTSASLGLS